MIVAVCWSCCPKSPNEKRRKKWVKRRDRDDLMEHVAPVAAVNLQRQAAIHAPSATSQSAARKRVANQAKNCKLPEQIANSATNW